MERFKVRIKWNVFRCFGLCAYLIHLFCVALLNGNISACNHNGDVCPECTCVWHGMNVSQAVRMCSWVPQYSNWPPTPNNGPPELLHHTLSCCVCLQACTSLLMSADWVGEWQWACLVLRWSRGSLRPTAYRAMRLNATESSRSAQVLQLNLRRG